MKHFMNNILKFLLLQIISKKNNNKEIDEMGGNERETGKRKALTILSISSVYSSRSQWLYLLHALSL